MIDLMHCTSPRHPHRCGCGKKRQNRTWGSGACDFAVAWPLGCKGLGVAMSRGLIADVLHLHFWWFGLAIYRMHTSTRVKR